MAFKLKKRHAKFQRATKQLKKKNEKLANLPNLPNGHH